jgi:hypothetical protein
MKWTYSIKNKLVTSVLLFLVLGLVMYTNFSERQNSSRINETLTTIYEDRLVVESYIFQYAGHLHRIIDIIDDAGYSDSEKQASIAFTAKEINALNKAYLETRLTRDEEIDFNRFTALCGNVEAHSAAAQFIEGKRTSKEALAILSNLSSIQVAEGKAEVSDAEKLFTSARAISQFEITVLIIIALIIQVLLFAARTLQGSTLSQPHRLN